MCSKKDGTILTLLGSLLNFVYVLNYLLMKLKVADQITVCALSKIVNFDTFLVLGFDVKISREKVW